MKKKILSIILALCVALSVCVMPAYADEAAAISQVEATNVITITVDGNAVDCNVYGQLPVIVEGRTLVPLRAVFEALGATVDWNNDTRTVTSVRGEVGISLAVGSTALVVNGETKTIDVPAQIMNDRTMVPVRAVAEAFGCKVEWNNDTRTVVIATVVENGPEAVVKKACDAMLALDFATVYECYENPEAAMGEFAGAEDMASLIDMLSDEELTMEQKAMIKVISAKIMSLITYEIKGSAVNGDVATVNVTTYMPNVNNIDADAFMANTSGNMMDVLFEVATDAGKVSVDEVVTLKLKDGKWLIVE